MATDDLLAVAVLATSAMKESESTRRIHIPANDSATQRICINNHKISLLSALNEVLSERRSVERRRNTLLQAAAMRQHQVQEMNIKCEAAWLEKIAEAQGIGRKWEATCASLREKREALHKQLLNSFEGSVPPKSHDFPSIRANYKMQAIQLQKEIAELKRRVNNAKFRLENETRVRDLLNNEVRKLKNEAGAKKVHTASVRPHTLALVSHPATCRPARENFRAHIIKRKQSPVSSRGKAL